MELKVGVITLSGSEADLMARRLTPDELYDCICREYGVYDLLKINSDQDLKDEIRWRWLFDDYEGHIKIAPDIVGFF